MMPAQHSIAGICADLDNTKSKVPSTARERLARARAVLALRALASQALVRRAVYGDGSNPFTEIQRAWDWGSTS